MVRDRYCQIVKMLDQEIGVCWYLHLWLQDKFFISGCCKGYVTVVNPQPLFISSYAIPWSCQCVKCYNWGKEVLVCCALRMLVLNLMGDLYEKLCASEFSQFYVLMNQTVHERYRAISGNTVKPRFIVFIGGS
jgi:hypothetical protein